MASSESAALFPLSSLLNLSSTLTIADTDPIEHSNSNMEDAISAPIPIPKKKNQGRLKIAIKKIENKNRKHVTFSKRRKGLFKKATELCVLCDASVAVIAFSEAGKVFTFGHPTTDAVIHRYLGKAFSDPATGTGDQFWWERTAVEELGLQELESFHASLRQMKSRVERRILDLDLSAPIKTDFDDYCGYGFDDRLVPIQAPMGDQMMMMSSYCDGVNAGVSFGSPDFPPPADQNLYLDYGCMGGGYDESSGMVAHNRFGEYFS